jgi:HNH endonuclease
LAETERPLCPCHGLPMWSNGPNRFVCRVTRAARKLPATQAARDRAAKKAARQKILDPERGMRFAQKAAASRYAAARALNREVRGVSDSPRPVDRGPDLPPLCACHHEPMLSDGGDGWRCGPQRRSREREREKELKTADYGRYREKRQRSERRRRARERGVKSEPYTRQEVYERDGGACRYCGEQVADDWHIAHLVALARGGEDTLDNVAVSCAPCNVADGVGRLPVQLHLPRAA